MRPCIPPLHSSCGPGLPPHPSPAVVRPGVVAGRPCALAARQRRRAGGVRGGVGCGSSAAGWDLEINACVAWRRALAAVVVVVVVVVVVHCALLTHLPLAPSSRAPAVRGEDYCVQRTARRGVCMPARAPPCSGRRPLCPPAPLQWEGDGDAAGEMGSSKTIDFVYDPDSDTPGGRSQPLPLPAVARAAAACRHRAACRRHHARPRRRRPPSRLLSLVPHPPTSNRIAVLCPLLFPVRGPLAAYPA